MDKRKKILIGVASILGALALYFVAQHLMYVTTDNAQVEAHTLLLGPKVSGFVLQVKVVEGQKVKQGDVLVEIDERDYQNSLKQIKGELASIEARKRDAERNFRRISELFGSGAVSQQQYDTATTAFSEIRAKFEGISAQVNQAEINLENTKIKAPSDGFIAKRSVEVGQLAAAGTPLIGFVDGRERWVEANLKETDISNVAIGAKVEVEVDAIGGRSFHGKVESVSAATGSRFTLLPPDNATGNFTKVVQRVAVKIVLEDLNEKEIEMLRAGLSAEVKIRR